MFVTIESVILTLLFIIPGYIINSLVCKLSPHPQASVGESILTHIFFSAINSAFIILPLWEITKEKQYESNPLPALFLFFISIFIMPILWGLIFSIFFKYGIIEALLRYIGFKPKSNTQTGWDRIFDKIDRDMFAKIITTSGRILYVKFEDGSHISSSGAANADIFASQIYSFDENDATGKWELYEPGMGVLIPRTSIQYIVFIDPYFTKKEGKNGR